MLSHRMNLEFIQKTKTLNIHVRITLVLIFKTCNVYMLVFKRCVWKSVYQTRVKSVSNVIYNDHDDSTCFICENDILYCIFSSFLVGKQSFPQNHVFSACIQTACERLRKLSSQPTACDYIVSLQIREFSNQGCKNDYIFHNTVRVISPRIQMARRKMRSQSDCVI
jgi:hypothetical protein